MYRLKREILFYFCRSQYFRTWKSSYQTHPCRHG
uniref:Uncharacterized protein n=1 Tax=Anguilla anguilla TaxID=7936 RepID=A0A0E9TTT2_ANGAN